MWLKINTRFSYKSIAVFIFLFLILLLASADAQDTGNDIKFDKAVFFSAKRYFSVTVIPLAIAAKSNIKGDTKKYSLKSAPQLSFEALINCHYDFEKNYSLIFGAGGGVIGHNLDYVIPKEMFDPPTGSDITSNKALSREMDLFYFKVPVEIERRWNSGVANSWNTNIGISLLFSINRTVEGFDAVFLYDGRTYKYLARSQNSNNHGKPWLNYHIASGYTWQLPRKNSIRANVKINMSFAEFAKVSYSFDLPSQPILEGQYGVTGSYIGLSLSYIFSGPSN